MYKLGVISGKVDWNNARFGVKIAWNVCVTEGNIKTIRIWYKD